MSLEEERLIKKIANELAGSMQQGRDKEVSGLFRDLKKDIQAIRNDLNRLEDTVKRYESIVESHKLIEYKVDAVTDNQKWVVRALIGGIIGIVLAGITITS